MLAQVRVCCSSSGGGMGRGEGVRGRHSRHRRHVRRMRAARETGGCGGGAAANTCTAGLLMLLLVLRGIVVASGCDGGRMHEGRVVGVGRFGHRLSLLLVVRVVHGGGRGAGGVRTGVAVRTVGHAVGGAEGG